MYKKLYVSEDGLRLRSSPNTNDVSNVIKDLKKDEELEVFSGPWYEVRCEDKIGWVHGDYLKENPSEEIKLIDDKQDLYSLPSFVIGESNLVDNLNTKKVRDIIKDEFGGGRDNDCLQCVEYVQYKIQQMNIVIEWPVKCGRNGGNWGNIFKQHDLYNVSDTPTDNCAMSFTDGISTNKETNKIGHIAFIEKVNEDGSIEISEANWPKNGIYSVRTLPKTKWQDQYKGVFINFLGAKE